MRYNFLLKLKNKPNRFQKPVRFESSMKITFQIFLFISIIYSCTVKDKTKIDSDFRKYELASNQIKSVQKNVGHYD
jgi:hypothetical protein